MASRNKSSKTKTSAIERELLEDMERFRDDLKAGVPIAEKYACRRVTLELSPQKFEPRDVKKTRELLNASQGLFAQLLGVSPKTVQSWESGNRISAMARRFLEEIQHDPAYWRRRLAQTARAKTS